MEHTNFIDNPSLIKQIGVINRIYDAVGVTAVKQGFTTKCCLWLKDETFPINTFTQRPNNDEWMLLLANDNNRLSNNLELIDLPMTMAEWAINKAGHKKGL